jgi:hypothetical protein
MRRSKHLCDEDGNALGCDRPGNSGRHRGAKTQHNGSLLPRDCNYFHFTGLPALARDAERLALYTDTDRDAARFQGAIFAPAREEIYVSIVRVGLAETKKFAEGYEAIFGKKKSGESKKTKPVAKRSAAKTKKKTSKKN